MEDAYLERLVLNLDSDHFNEFQRLISFQEIEATAANVPFLAACAQELDYQDLRDFLARLPPQTEPVTKDNVMSQLRWNQSVRANVHPEIEFIASHFYELEFEFLSGLSPVDLELVVKNRKFLCQSEDQLFTTITRLGERYFSLYSYVHFLVLAPENFEEFKQRTHENFLIHPCGLKLTPTET